MGVVLLCREGNYVVPPFTMVLLLEKRRGVSFEYKYGRKTACERLSTICRKWKEACPSMWLRIVTEVKPENSRKGARQIPFCT